MKSLLQFLAGIVVAASCVGMLHAEDLIVTTAADENDPAGTTGTGLSLREALRDASDGTIIRFDAAVFNGEPGDTITVSHEIVIGKSVTVDAGNIVAGVTISDPVGTPFGIIDRLFTIGSGRDVTLLGLTFVDGGGIEFGGNGGAISSEGNLTLAHCTFSGFAADRGGALFNDGGTLTLTDCTLSGNSAENGGALVNSGGDVSLTRCTLTGNSDIWYGGGAIDNSGTLTIKQCTFAFNGSASNGGAIQNQGSGVLRADSSTFHANYAYNAAGALSGIAGSETILTHCTFAGNTALFLPSGIWMDSDDSGASLEMNYCIVADAVAGRAFTGNHNLLTAEPLLAPLGSYGGSTQTMALLPDSPARDMATDSPATADQRGFPIVGTPDIGAYEAGTLAPNYSAYIQETLPAAATADQHAGTFDFDSDGQTNEAEWFALTNAASGASFFLPALRGSGANCLLSFASNTGRIYRLRQSEDLGAWSDTPGQSPLTGDGRDQTFVLPRSAARRFYQIVPALP